MKKFINWKTIIIIIILILIIYGYYNLLSPSGIKEWCSKTLSKLNAGDILILVIIHAWISRSEINCNCKDKNWVKVLLFK